MCGIVAAISNRDVQDILLEGLKRLEYRGYDSAGLAVLNPQAKLACVKKAGKVQALIEAVNQQTLAGKTGIAHTRWATHGVPNEVNAHPHCFNQIALVHNGIIENYQELKSELSAQGAVFVSDTDSEVIAHLIAGFYQQGHTLLQAVQHSLKKLKGAYAIAVLAQDNPDELVCARQGSPLVIGLGIGENFIGSDALALQNVTNRFVYLEEGDTALLTRLQVSIFDAAQKSVERRASEFSFDQDSADKGNFRHFMEKEIFEQPKALAATMNGRLGEHTVFVNSFGLNAEAIFKQVKNIHIVACGTSYHAGMIAKYWLEEHANMPCHVEVASEYRYRKKVIPENTLLLCISQSGETADTLAALKNEKQKFLASLCICNVYNSSLVRECDFSFMTNAGAEIGVASTKAFTTQLVALLIFMLALANAKQPQTQTQTAVAQLKQLPALVEQVLLLNKAIEQLARRFIEKNHALFVGRGVHFPVALEGALKLKEISYIHAEAYPAGELKHGPLALVDKDMPVIALAPDNALYEKLDSNMQEVAARGGELFVLMDAELAQQHKVNPHLHILPIPKTPELLAPIIYTIPLQLLAYHVALIKGTDVDQPRNLAKSVTVE